jgi:hypothetical protein
MKGLLSRLLGLGRREKHIWDTTPGGPYEVAITDQGLTCTHPKRPAETIRWDQVREIALVTTSYGPFLPDEWYVFTGDGTYCSVPSEARGFEGLWDVFKSRFPTIDYEAIIAAGTEDEKTVIWRR